MNVLIIEDEPKTALDLANVIQKQDPSIRIVKIIETVKDSLEFLKASASPDVIFSDIQLADGSCFEIFRHIDVECPIVFCSAYDEYAIEAFKTNGIDYITKPFSDHAIARALNKMDNLRKHFEKPQLNKLVSRLLQQKPYTRQSFLVNIRDKFIPVNVSGIAFFHVKNDAVYIHTFDGKKHIINLTLEEIETSLDSNSFFRANRQFLLSRKVIKEAIQYYGRKLLVTLNVESPEEIVISRAKATEILEWLNL